MIKPVLRRGAAPLGLVFGGLACAAAFGVWLLQLDRLPVTLCVFKAVTGLPCLTCGSTRVLGHLATGDLAGALWLNPLATLGAAALLFWAVSDAVLVPTGRSLVVEVRDAAVPALRWTVAAAALVNWAWLVASGV